MTRMQGRFWPDTPVPLRPDGSVDVLTVCRWLDEQASVAFQQVSPYESNRCSGRIKGASGIAPTTPRLAESSDKGPTP